jgi:hypothetical protein
VHVGDLGQRVQNVVHARSQREQADLRAGVAHQDHTDVGALLREPLGQLERRSGR